jgi:hypothetical protein
MIDMGLGQAINLMIGTLRLGLLGGGGSIIGKGHLIKRVPGEATRNALKK